MEPKEPEKRLINQAVGEAPTLGSLTFSQIIPIFGLALAIYYAKEIFGFPWLFAAILWGFLSGILLALLGNRPSLFWSRLMPKPNWARGGLDYELYRNLKQRRRS